MRIIFRRRRVGSNFGLLRRKLHRTNCSRQRRAPRFAILKWIYFHRVLEQQNITNNSVEAFNNVISSQNANCRHPGLFPFIELLKKEQTMAEMKFAQLVPGEQAI